MKFVDVFQFYNYLLEEMSRCNCFSLQLLGGGDSKRTLDREAGVRVLSKVSQKASQKAYEGLRVPRASAGRGNTQPFHPLSET